MSRCFGFECHWLGQCTEAIYCDTATYDLHRKTFIKAAEVGIAQHQSNLRYTGGREAALETVRTTAQFVIPARTRAVTGWQTFLLRQY
jgi:hypothetical protein